MSVHAGVERNVCIIKVSAETPPIDHQSILNARHVQTSTLTPVSPPRLPQPLVQPFAQMCYRCKYQVSSTGPNRPEVCLYNLFVSTCEFVTTNPISLHILQFHQSFRCSHTQSMNVDKDKTNPLDHQLDTST